MTAPIETAYAALATAIATALVAAGFLPAPAALQIDPPSPFEPSGDETEVITAAALLVVSTEGNQRRLGGPVRRYVVERTCRLELAACGPVEALWRAALAAAETALAPLCDAEMTLGGTCEAVELGSFENEDLEPNGAQRLVTFLIRLRSGDPLGRTP